MRIDILTLFPDFFSSPLSTSLLSKAIKKKIVGIYLHNIRDFGTGKHKSVDDRPFGGGPGMVLKVDVLSKALESTIEKSRKAGCDKKPWIVLLDPAGERLTQEKAKKLSKKGWIILICGHYEGVDERFKELYLDQEISIGDYVLNGGEAAAFVLIEAVSRLLPGFLNKRESVQTESFSKEKIAGKEITLLDYPCYTRPERFKGKGVPKILISGNHEKIRKWRMEQALKKTKKQRPDLLRKQKSESRKRIF